LNFITKSEIKVLKELDFKKVIENQISLKNNKIEKIKNIGELIEMQNLTATSSNDKI